MLEELKKWLKAEIKDKKIFDIVVYGSSVKGKINPNDVDIAVIFREGKLKERLEIIQKIKENIVTDKKIDIKAIMLEELFDAGFFARSGIIFEGISIKDNKQFSNKIGFNSNTIFIHNLKDKTHTEKVKFNYLLSGRTEKGIVRKLEGRQLAPGVIEIPVRNSLEFEEILNKHKISFNKMNILVEK